MIHVLDHGYVRLVSYMQPVPRHQVSCYTSSSETAPHADIIEGRLQSEWTGDLEIIRNARVSHDADWRNDGEIVHEALCGSLIPGLMSDGTARPCNCTPRTVSDKRLMDYLYKNIHSTPFEAMVFTFEVKAPLFVFRQWHRHRTWSYNEVSARYSELPSEYYVPPSNHIGQQDVKNRQGRTIDLGKHASYDDIVEAGYSPTDVSRYAAEMERRQRIVESFGEEAAHAHQRYQDRLGSAVPREIARINLPLSTYSRMFATVNLWNLFRFLNLRDHDHAQYEIRVYAQALKTLVQPIVPNAVAAFDRYKISVTDLEAADGS